MSIRRSMVYAMNVWLFLYWFNMYLEYWPVRGITAYIFVLAKIVNIDFCGCCFNHMLALSFFVSQLQFVSITFAHTCIAPLAIAFLFVCLFCFGRLLSSLMRAFFFFLFFALCLLFALVLSIFVSIYLPLTSLMLFAYASLQLTC